jgi:hypothetical protein
MANRVAHNESGGRGLDRPRELLTLAIVIGCVGFWSLALWGVGAIYSVRGKARTFLQ